MKKPLTEVEIVRRIYELIEKPMPDVDRIVLIDEPIMTRFWAWDWGWARSWARTWDRARSWAWRWDWASDRAWASLLGAAEKEFGCRR